MQTPNSTTSFLFLLVVTTFSCLWAASAGNHEDFLRCLHVPFGNDTSSVTIYTSDDSSFTSVLEFSIRNWRIVNASTSKPLAIVTPSFEFQVRRVVYCAKENGMQIRTRSGGHDFEGLSYTSNVPFVILDLINLSDISIDANKKTAWIQAGATNGQLYYRIAEKSKTLGFPAAVCTTLGAGGLFSGGGYGGLLRKYGLAADHIIDARIVDAKGRILDRKSMGEDLFWAIRGGGGASFGVILAWKIKLVNVPQKVTVFTINRNMAANGTHIVHRWQYVAPKLHKDLFIRVFIRRAANSNQTGVGALEASISSLFLGGIDRLIPYMQKQFPELGLVREDCREMSWVESTLYLAGFPSGSSLDVLLNRTIPKMYFKSKSDYVKKPISLRGFDAIWKLLLKDEARRFQFLFVPYGGRMAEITESALPFPHRAGNLYKIHYGAFWDEMTSAEDSKRLISFVRKLYRYMARHVSKVPREAYLNYRDLDLGVNNNGSTTTYAKASIWGKKYFKNNFDKLVQVKTKVDPQNFFRNEQSIPSLYSSH